MLTKTLSSQKVRFAAVGLLNTIVDFSIYTLLVFVSGNIFISNLVSTSCGMGLSYLLNKLFTFRSTSTNKKREIGLFLLVTLFGLWVIHPLVIWSVDGVFENLVQNLPSVFQLMIPKAVAIGVGLVWNYIWYSRTVFNERIK